MMQGSLTSTSKTAPGLTLIGPGPLLASSVICALLRKSDWDEEKHPRDKDGRFGSGAGGSMSELVNKIGKPDGGFTYQPVTDSSPVAGYPVSIYPERSVAIDADNFSYEKLVGYAASNADILSDPENHIGAWHDPDTGVIYLDVSVVKASEEEARELALAHDQIAYFDLANGKSVTVNRDATSGGAALKGDRYEPKTGIDISKAFRLRRGSSEQFTGDVRKSIGPQGDARGDSKGQGRVFPDVAAHRAATSYLNLTPQPTEGQKEAGNYLKGHVKIAGLNISIENPAGSKRNPDWPTLQSHYGYIKGTNGADGDHVDCFIRPSTSIDWYGDLYVIDQLNQDTNGFDEHKVMIGYDDEQQATKAYLSNYDRGWKLGNVTTMSLGAFKVWLKTGDTTAPLKKEWTASSSATSGITAYGSTPRKRRHNRLTYSIQRNITPCLT